MYDVNIYIIRVKLRVHFFELKFILLWINCISNVIYTKHVQKEL